MENWVQEKELNVAEVDKLVHDMQKAWEDYEVVKKQADELKKKYEDIESKVLFTLKDAGKSKWFVDGLGTAYIINKFQVKVPKDPASKDLLFQYIMDKGKDAFLGLVTVNSKTLNSFYNEELKDAVAKGNTGFSIPGVEEPTMRESLGFRKDKK